MRRVLLPALYLAIVLAILGWITRPAPLAAPVVQHPLATTPEALDGYLTAAEAQVEAVHGIIPGAEKRIRWAGAPGEHREYALVYLHGFSATRQEIAPVPEQLATALDANLFETRLAGHGLQRDALTDVRAEQWLRDAEEALAVGSALGDRLIVMGTSTGATLAVALARHPQFSRVDSLILLSPNFGPAAAGSELATGPFGPQLVRLLAGEERSWEAANAMQAKYWTTRYPNAVLIEMMRLVDLARAEVANTRTAQAVLVYSEDDEVVSVPQFKDAFAKLQAGRKHIIEIEDGGGPSSHVLAGDILAPENTAPLVEKLARLLRAQESVSGDS